MNHEEMIETLEKVQANQRAEILERQERERKDAQRKLNEGREGDDQPIADYINQKQTHADERKRFDQQADKVRQSWQKDPKNRFNNTAEREIEQGLRHAEGWRAASKERNQKTMLKPDSSWLKAQREREDMLKEHPIKTAERKRQEQLERIARRREIANEQERDNSRGRDHEP